MIIIAAVMIMTAGSLFLGCKGGGDDDDDDRPPDTQDEAIWQSRGIGGGGALYSATISPHDSRHAFIATDMSAVFESTDFGITWRTKTFLNLQGGVDSHIRFTSDPQILYSIDLRDDLRRPVRSGDGGSTWSVLTQDPTEGEVFLLFADPGVSNRVMVSSWDTLYFSSDSGNSFHTVATAEDSGAGLHIGGVFWLGNRIIVGIREGLLVSEDGGISFAPHSIGGIPDDEGIVSLAGAASGATRRLIAVTLDRGDIWAGLTGSEHWGYRGVYRLDWGDSTWTRSTDGIESGAHPFFVAMADGDISTAYLGGSHEDTSAPIVYKTDNGGQSWQSVFRTDENANIMTGWSGAGGDEEWWYGEYVLSLAVAPGDPDRAIITDLGFVHITDDGGATWRQAYVRPEDANPVGQNTPQGRFYQGNGVEDTSCWWLHWVDSGILIAGFSDVGGIRSEDGGQSWQAGGSIGLTYNSTYCVVEHEASGTLYAAVSTAHDLYQSPWLADSRIDDADGGIMRSADGGRSWAMFHDFGHPVIWLTFDPNQQNRLFASAVNSQSGGIYVTDDVLAASGGTWRQLTSPPRTQGHPLSIAVLPDGALAVSYSGRRDGSGAFTDSSGVFLSTNGGESWQDRSDSRMHYWTKDLVIDPHDQSGNTWYACVFSHWGSGNTDTGGLYRTPDRGVTWQRLNTLYRVESLTIHPTQRDRAWLSTEMEGLYTTSDLSAATPTFTLDPDFPFRQPTRIFISPHDTNEIWVASFGGGLRVSIPDSGQ